MFSAAKHSLKIVPRYQYLDVHEGKIIEDEDNFMINDDKEHILSRVASKGLKLGYYNQTSNDEDIKVEESKGDDEVYGENSP
jgi:hypothetical protein